MFFNPYLGPLARFSDSAIGFLRPVFFGLASRLIAAAALVLLLVLRGAAAPKGSGWILSLGFEIRQTGNPPFVASMVFSALSFGIFLFKLWGLSLIYVPTRMGRPSAHNAAALYHLAKPFSHVRREFRPIVLLVCGLAIAWLLHAFGTPPPDFIARDEFGLPSQILHAARNQPAAVAAGRILISVLDAVVGIIGVVLQLVFALIIASWVSLLTGSHGLTFFCREWMDMLLGPLRRHPIRIGMLDLSPLIFILAVGFAQTVLHTILLRSYLRLI
jgi:uncharacterized protein YggT (Ycf19 family)